MGAAVARSQAEISENPEASTVPRIQSHQPNLKDQGTLEVEVQALKDSDRL